MLIASTANIIAYWSIEQDLLFLPFWPIKIGNNIDVVQCIVCHVERSEPLGRWPKGKANISQMPLAKSQRGILDFSPFGRRPKGSDATLCQDDTHRGTICILGHCYIISLKFANRPIIS